MAIPPANNDAFFREVDEELRRDQVQGWVRRYGRHAIAAVLIFLVTVAAFLFWQSRREAVAGAEGERLSLAIADLGQDKPAAAAPVLADLAGSSRAGIAALARLTQADVALQGKDAKRAAALFKAVADDESVPQPFRDAALVRQIAIDYDALAPGAVIARLQPLAAAGNPWFGSAGEMVAMAQAKMGRTRDAGQLFAAIAQDKQVPESLRSRAAQMAGVYGVEVLPPSGNGGAGAAR